MVIFIQPAEIFLNLWQNDLPQGPSNQLILIAAAAVGLLLLIALAGVLLRRRQVGGPRKIDGGDYGDIVSGIEPSPHSNPISDPILAAGQNDSFTKTIHAPDLASGAEVIKGLEPVQQAPSLSAPVEYRFGRRTDVGRVRNLNEDSLLTIETLRATTSILRPAGVFVIADGMGGHAAGEVASGAIVNFIQARCLPELGAAVPSGASVDWANWLKTTVEEVNKHVFELRESTGTDMGSTMVMAFMDGARAYITHIGDSRAYRINNREIHRLTIDHSLVERLVAIGQVRREEAHNHPQKNVIYRTVGNKPGVDVETSVIDLAVGDRLLLCSDGLNGMLLDEQIHTIVLGANSPQSACDGLVTAANAAGGEDNISVIVVEIVRG